MVRSIDPDVLKVLRAENRRLRAAVRGMAPGIHQLLQRRGFSIYRKEPDEGLFLPSQKYRAAYYRLLHNYSFRIFLRDVIKQRASFTLTDVARYAAAPVTAGYLGYLRSVGLVKRAAAGLVSARPDVSSFGATLEWFVSELFRREFGCETVWGVKFKRPDVGGDYDVIAAMAGALYYIETKSAPPKQVKESEIEAFLDRVEDLAPAIAVFLMDTELRMRDKIVPMFENELRRRAAYPPPVIRLERELYHIQNRVYILNAKESILRNLTTVVSRAHRQAASPWPVR